MEQQRNAGNVDIAGCGEGAASSTDDSVYMESFIRRLAEIYIRSSDAFFDFYNAQDKNDEKKED